MINVGSKPLKALYHGADAVSKVYIGSELIWGGGALPSGYTRVQYIRNGIKTDGTNVFRFFRIPIDVRWCDAKRIELDVEIAETSVNGTNMALVSDDGFSPTTPWACISANQYSAMTVTNRYYDGSAFVLDFTSVVTNHICYGGWSDNIWTGIYKLSGMRVYGVDGLLFNGLPALDANGVPCLYDTVSKTTNYNAGTGTYLYE